MAIGEWDLRRFLVDRIARACELSVGDVDPDRLLEQYGLTSRDAVAATAELEDLLGRRLEPAAIWRYPTVNQMIRGLLSDTWPDGIPITSPEPLTGQEIAVIGLACRLPGGIDSPEAYWRSLTDGGTRSLTDDGTRSLVGGGEQSPVDGGVRTGRWEEYDAGFFGVTPETAGERMVLEVAWEALEYAGISPRTLAGSRTGVFGAEGLTPLLGLSGPVEPTGAPVAQAIASLRGGESDLALAVLPLLADQGCQIVILKRLADADRDLNQVLALCTTPENQNPHDTKSGDAEPSDAASGGSERGDTGPGGTGPGNTGPGDTGPGGAGPGDRVIGGFFEAVLIADRGITRGLTPWAVGRSALVAEAVVRRARPAERTPSTGPARLLLSDLSIDRVQEYAGLLAAHLRGTSDGSSADVAHTLARRLGRGPVRAAVVGRGRADLTAGLTALAQGNEHPGVVSAVATEEPPRPVWVFPGTPARAGPREAAGAGPHEAAGSGLHEAAGGGLSEAADGGLREAAGGGLSEAADGGLREAAGGGLGEAAGGALREAAGGGARGAVGSVAGFGGVAGLRELAEGVPGFVGVIAELEPLLGWAAGVSLRDAVLGGEVAVGDELPVAYAVQVALALCWRQYGVVPAAIVGDGAGEVAAAVVAGGLTATEGARVIAALARTPDQVSTILADLAPAAPRVPYYSATSSEAIPFGAEYWGANLKQPTALGTSLSRASVDGHQIFFELMPDALTFHTQLATLEVLGYPVVAPAGRVVDVPLAPWRTA
jgi:phthiocerol/phenolphthiocerol synthesis type-I polyketide synthase D